MRTSCTITLDLEKVGLWCGWLYGYMWVAYISTSSSAKWIRTREMWELQIESAQGSSGRTVRPSVRPFQWLARVELVFMSTTVQSGSIKLVIGTAIYRRYRSITNQWSRLEKKAGPKFFRNQHKVTKTFSIPGHQEDIQTWRHSNMKIFRHEDIQAWRLSNVMTSIKEGYPSTRRSSTKKIFKLTFTPFCPSLELLSYDITYVI